MPETTCQISTDPSVKAAWEACDAAESKLEAHLLSHPALGSLAVDAIGTTYFIESGRMLSAPTCNEGGFDRDLAFHRTEYEGMDADQLSNIAAIVQAAVLHADGA